MQVSDGMSRVVLSIGPGLSLRETARLMSERNVGAAVIVDEDSPVPGVISERDVLHAIARGEDLDKEVVANHAPGSFISAAPDWSMERAAMEMSRRKIRHLIVIDHGELVGILSIRDIVRVWMSDGATADVISPNDEALAASHDGSPPVV